MMQWQCPTCKQWVSMTYSKHIHVVEAAPDLASMLQAREAGIDATDLNLHETPWSPDYPRRKAPDA